MKNKKHLQGIGNNLVYSLANYPANYLPFWSHLYRPHEEVDLKFHLLSDNDFPEFLTGEECQDMKSILDEYRGFFLRHLEMYKIDLGDIKEAYIHIFAPHRRYKMRVFNINFIVKTIDDRTYTSTIVRTYWGDESKDIETFDNGWMKKEAHPY